MKKSLLILTSLLLTSSLLFTQTVETLAGPNPRINNGLVVNSNGDIFASDLFGSGFNGSQINKISPDGSSTLFANGLRQPAGLAFDDAGMLYVAEFTTGMISKIDEVGSVTRWISGLNQPADLVFDSNGNLYVTNYGNGILSKIDKDGRVSTLASGFNQPVGLAIDDNEHLYVANLSDGNIHKVDLEGNKSVLATIAATPIGFMTYSSNHLYVASTGGHKIYRVGLDGTVNEFAGTGMRGTKDGAASTAQFTNPDGIAFSPSGDSLYVSENNSNLLRRILLDTTTGLEEARPPNNELEHLHLFPNPAAELATAQFQLNTNSHVELLLFSTVGHYIQTVFSTYLMEGKHAYPVSVEALPPGAYLLQLKSEQASQHIMLRVF